MKQKPNARRFFGVTVVFPDGSHGSVMCEDYRQCVEVVAAEAKTAEPMTMFIIKQVMSDKPFDRFGISADGDLVHHPYR